MTLRYLPAILVGFRHGQGSAEEIQVRRAGRAGKRGPKGRPGRRYRPGATYLSAVRLAQYAAVSHQGNPGLDSAPVLVSCFPMPECRQTFPGDPTWSQGVRGPDLIYDMFAIDRPL